MGRLGLLVIAVLLAGAVLEAEAQRISFDYVKELFNNREAIKEFKNALGDRFNKLDKKIQGYINDGDFTNATATELLGALEDVDWEKLKPKILTRMSKAELEKLAAQGRVEIPKRFLEQLELLTILEMSDEDIVNIVKTKIPQLNPGEVNALMRRLGPMKFWTSDNITNFGPAVLRLPVCFDSSDDEEVLEKVRDLITNCMTTNPPSGCPKNDRLSPIYGSVHMKLLGDPKKWTSSDMEDLVILDVPFFMIPQISDSFIRDFKPKLIKELEEFSEARNQMEREVWVTVLCRAEDCNGMSTSEARTWFDDLSSMRKLVTPSDLPAAALEDNILAVQVEENAINQNMIRPKDAAIVLDRKLNKETPEALRDIGGKLAVWAPACYLAKAAENKELSAVRNDLVSVLDMVRGPEYMAKVRAAMEMEMEAAFSNNVFSISKVSDYLKAFLSPKLLSDQNSATLISLAMKADEEKINLNPHQMEVIVSKISVPDSRKCPRSLCQRLPVSFMTSLSSSVLAEIDRNSHGVTLPCLLGAKKKFGDSATLTPEIMEDGKAFLKCMSYEYASKVEAKDIFKVFEKIKDENLSWPACRALSMKLTEWGDEKFDDTFQGELLTALYLNEMYRIPACVAVMLEPSIYKLSMDMKKAFLSNLCTAKNYFIIPKDTRSKLVNTLLSEIMEGPITVCNMEKLGACTFDLSPSMLRKMESAAMMAYMIMVETSIRGGVPDCLDDARMDAVADMLIRMRGPVRTWKSVDDVSCILETSSSSGINRIVNDLDPEVLITTGCPMQDNTFQAMPKRCVDTRNSAMMDRKKRKVDNCVRLRKSLGTENTCDQMMCGNVLRMTSSDLERMKKEDVMKYLKDLTTEDLDMGKAKVVLAKVKESKALQDMSAKELGNIRYAWRGLTMRDVSALPTLKSPEHDEVVHHLGMIEDLPDDVMIALRDKMLREIKEPKKMESMDVFLLGNIVCYMTKEQIGDIPKDTIRKSMRNLGMLDCKNNATYYLAEAAKEASGKAVKDWDASTLHEMNLLVCGLDPEDFSALPAEAYIGITDKGMPKIEPNTLKVMTSKQANNLDGSTAAAVTSAQASKLTAEVRSTVTNAKTEEEPSGATGLLVPPVMGAVAAAVLFLFL